jgi:hypothetical protein
MVYAMCNLGKPADKSELLKVSRIPSDTATRVLEDLGLLGIIEKKGTIDIAYKRSVATWGLSTEAEEWAKAAGLYTHTSITNGHSPKAQNKNTKLAKLKFRKQLG